jgi:hypothetical protein
MRIVVSIARRLGQESMAGVTHAAQIDLRFGYPVREFLYFGVSFGSGYFTRERFDVFETGWVRVNRQGQPVA